MNVDGNAKSGQCKVRVTGNLGGMKPEPIAEPVQFASNDSFRSSIAGSDAGHHPATGLPIDYIRQLSSVAPTRTDPAE